METVEPVESCDAIVVGARCAGSAASIALARGGRSVVTLDRSSFPSDTLSTHLLFPAGVAELARIGALERVLALDPPECREILLDVEGEARVRERFTPVDGIAYGMCVPRPQLDEALVQTARGHGVDVRERCSVEEVLVQSGRAAGVRYRTADGERRVLRAPLVIGADGRRSTVAQLVGSDRPYRGSRNERGLVFRYCDDPLAGTQWRHVMAQWRAGATHGMAFPCPDDRLLVLFMGPAEDIADFRRDPEGAWERQLRANPGLRRRTAGATNATKLRSTPDTPAFFRVSSGPGWALTGDAGHFKDPVIAQGIRDALRFGRLLGESAAPALHDPARLDAALLQAERHRDRECLASYHWGNRESRAQPSSPLVIEALRGFSGPGPDASDMFGRVRTPERVLGPARGARALARAVLRRGADRPALVREAVEETRMDVDIRLERRRDEFRTRRPSRTERHDWQWPPAARSKPALRGREAQKQPA